MIADRTAYDVRYTGSLANYQTGVGFRLQVYERRTLDPIQRV